MGQVKNCIRREEKLNTYAVKNNITSEEEEFNLYSTNLFHEQFRRFDHCAIDKTVRRIQFAFN